MNIQTATGAQVLHLQVAVVMMYSLHESFHLAQGLCLLLLAAETGPPGTTTGKKEINQKKNEKFESNQYGT